MTGPSSFLTPDFYAPSVMKIDLDAVAERGVVGFLIDLDDTLLPCDGNPANAPLTHEECEAMEAATAEWLARAVKQFKIAIVTNNKRKSRLTRYLSRLAGIGIEIPYVLDARKPMVFGFKEALGKLGLKASDVAVVGDRLELDVVGSKLLGAKSILVDRLGGTESVRTIDREGHKVKEWVLSSAGFLGPRPDRERKGGDSKRMSMLEEEARAIKDKLEKEQSLKVKIALFGQPGSGKSTLINRLVGGKVAEVNPSTDTTREAQVIPFGDLVLVDLPGYGTSRFPANDFFEKFDIESFDLYLCVSNSKFHQDDSRFFRDLHGRGKVCLFIRNVFGELWQEGKTEEDLQEEIRQDLQAQIGDVNTDLFFVNCKTCEGISAVSDAIYEHLDRARQARWIRDSKAYTMEHLARKQESCKQTRARSSGMTLDIDTSFVRVRDNPPRKRLPGGAKWPILS